jgi:hypothetical protein
MLSSQLLDKFLAPAMAKLDKVMAGDTTSSQMDVDGPSVSSSKERCVGGSLRNPVFVMARLVFLRS